MNRVATSAVSLAALGALVLAATPAEAATTKSRALSVAKAQNGDWYKSGAVGPTRFDCSGLTLYSYKTVGKKLPRTAAQQYNATRRVAASKRQPGDLVFFGSPVYHVGIYAGSGYIWHAPGSGKKVRKEKLWTKNVRYGAVR